MERPIAISISPNATGADAATALQALVMPWLWRDHNILDTTVGKISDFLGAPVALTSSGRQALYDVLRAYDIGKGDEVIIQAFVCIAVPEAIIWTGAVPIYADIGKKSYNMDVSEVAAKITDKTRAIIVQHTFGIPAQIEEIKKIAAAHNIVVIEDCAHALGGSYKDRLLGTWGDAAIFSFGRDKVVSSVFGGAVVSADKRIITKVNEFAATRAHAPAWWIVQQLLHPIVTLGLLPLYFLSGIGKALLVACQKIGLLSKAVTAAERHGKMPEHVKWKFSPALSLLLNKQVSGLAGAVAARRKIAGRYEAALKGVSLCYPQSSDSQPAWLRYPIQVDDPKKILHLARRERMLLGDWYDAALVPADCSLEAFHYRSGSCPRAEEAATHVINLPTYPSLNEGQLEKLVHFIREHILG